MFKLIILPAAAITAASLTGSASPSMMLTGSASKATAEFSQATLDALDPTRLARTGCGTPDGGKAVLAARLRLAQDFAGSQAFGQAAMPLFAGALSTQVPASGVDGEARRYFDQGMVLAYGFNHAAAIRSFREASRRAPDCAMCWWGEALANGPNINAGMDGEQNQAALAALAQAKRLMDGASPLERALIEAQILRYSPAEGADRAALDSAYADAMIAIARANPANDDIAILAAEAAMNTTPWNYWDADKKPMGRIGTAVSMLERVIARNPGHPQAAHLYIHLTEDGPDPRMGEMAADRLVASAPAGVGHLIHMPAHIYHRIGRYADSMKANVIAARADEEYLALVGDDGLYRFGYYPHNVHFLLTSAQMVGDMMTVTNETERLGRILNVDVARAIPWVQAVHAAPSFAVAQYGSADAILARTAQPSELGYVEAMRHYARAIAYAQRQDETRFAAEIAAMDDLRAAPETVAMAEGGFPAADLIRLASLAAKGRYAHWAGEYAQAVDYFEQAEKIEATIPYTEPAYWYYPVAQSRGAALYSAGRYADARKAFTKALFQAPNDGWALYGLRQTEGKLGNRAEAAAADAALKKIWLGEPGWLEMTRL